MTKPNWQWDGKSAKLSLGVYTLTLSPNALNKGVALETSGEKLIGFSACALLTKEASEESRIFSLEEAYVRGDDFVAVYQPTKVLPLRLQVTWSGLLCDEQQEGLVEVGMTIRMQTPLLEIEPAIICQTSFDSNRMRMQSVSSSETNQSHREQSNEDIAAILIRPIDTSWSYAETIHPSDNRGILIDDRTKDNTTARWELFGSSLEKGVIRQARARFFLLDRKNDAATLVKAMQRFSASEVPLGV